MPRTRLLALAALLPLLGACDWFTDFKNQPRIEAWEPASQKDADTVHAPRGQPAFAVPVTGTQLAGYQVSYGAFPAVLDSIGRAVTNPTAPSPASLANGRKYYTINCSVCHGDTGVGNGPATQNGYGMPAINIVSATTQARSDGYIYGMMRNGRGLMPSYNRIEEMDRWDVVNYVRALQGRVPNTAGLGQVGYPGQNGVTVPGYTVTAPTRPAPHWRDARGPMGMTGAPTQAGETPAPAAAPSAAAADSGSGAPGAPSPGATAPGAAPRPQTTTPQPKGNRP
jgi:mono/diheme cytochrome c family protein